jgi:hypothetical protein
MSERSVRYRIECSVGNEGWDCPRLCWPPASILNDNDFTGHFWDLEKALAVLRELRTCLRFTCSISFDKVC